MDQYPTLTWETFYRVVPLRPGQAYVSGYVSVTGKKVVYEDTAYENQVLAVGNNDVDRLETLWTLSDEDIIHGHPDLRGSFADRAENYEPGYRDENYGTSIEKTGRPNIVRHLYPKIAFMIATEAVQFGCGGSFVVAQPGDFIIREGKTSTPRVIGRSLVDQGRIRFILPPAPNGKAPKPSFN